MYWSFKVEWRGYQQALFTMALSPTFAKRGGHLLALRVLIIIINGITAQEVMTLGVDDKVKMEDGMHKPAEILPGTKTLLLVNSRDCLDIQSLINQPLTTEFTLQMFCFDLLLSEPVHICQIPSVLASCYKFFQFES
ncbi:hypothetical protein F0562_009744 [Nyssa sinensis]|uniref:Uncharacterized protein n=1 Tax=Nyssa sinensis TaxID=561372 RepID=A0A5J5A1N3_9ASTE|nr:hypothetical protein F0562_009744 [Nyssa sinensis]